MNTSHSLTTSEEHLVQNSLVVSQLMKGEFILNPPCESTEAIIRETIEELGDNSYISIHKVRKLSPLVPSQENEYNLEAHLNHFSVQKKSYTNNVDDYGDSDEEYDDGAFASSGGPWGGTAEVSVIIEKIEFVNDEAVWRYFEFLRNLVVPYLEFCRVGLSVLKDLVPTNGCSTEKEEIELRQEILVRATQLMRSSNCFVAGMTLSSFYLILNFSVLLLHETCVLLLYSGSYNS